jgi:hypothetical protein
MKTPVLVLIAIILFLIYMNTRTSYYGKGGYYTPCKGHGSCDPRFRCVKTPNYGKVCK